MHIYLDNIFVFSDSVAKHEKHLGLIFVRLRKHEFYLKAEKLDLYADEAARDT